MSSGEHAVEASSNPSAAIYKAAHTTIDRFVFGDLRGEAVDSLRGYFHHEMYSGRRFERLDGGGDRQDVANQMTGTDLVTLPLLSVRLTRGEMIIALLETHAEQISQLLGAIPTEMPMHEAPWSHYAEDSPAHKLYWLLRGCRGVGRTTA